MFIFIGIDKQTKTMANTTYHSIYSLSSFAMFIAKQEFY